MLSSRINARLSGPMAVFVEKMVSDEGLYETSSEYVRDLIRRDMQQREGQVERAAILGGYQDAADGKFFASSGDYHKDMKVLVKRRADDWQ